MNTFDYRSEQLTQKTVGLIVLQSDETIEQDFRQLMPQSVNLHITRVPSGLAVTPDTLQQMETHLPATAELLPKGPAFDVVGYGCTSGTAQIGSTRVAELVRVGIHTAHVTEPVTALLEACAELGVTRLAMLSPYIENVSARLRDVLKQHGISTPVFGSFNEAEEEKVVRIDATSVKDAALNLVTQSDVGAIFLSCTNLRTLAVIDTLEHETGLPVLSSNQVLAWHMKRLAEVQSTRSGPGRLLRN